MSSDILQAKRKAVEETLKIVLNSERSIVGIGTGSTVDMFIDLMASSPYLFIESYFVCASTYTCRRLAENGFRVLNIADIDTIDVYIDGADEVDPDLNMVKGGGGALTLEKIIASAAKLRVYVVDYTKLVKHLGEKHAVPVEVLPHALSIVYRSLMELNLNPSIRRSREGKYGFVVTDTGGIIIDVHPKTKIDPQLLNTKLKSIPGVIETGIFTKDLVDLVVVGYQDMVTISRKLVTEY